LRCESAPFRRVWTVSEVDEALARFARCRVLVVGDLMLDRYIWGQVHRISPEAPVQVLDVHRETDTLGGAGNVANNLQALGAEVSVVGVLGGDNTGDRILSLLKSLDADVSGLVRDASRISTRKTRIIAAHQQVLRMDKEVRSPVPPDIESAVLERIEAQESRFDAVVVSDYGKGVLTESVLSMLMRLARTQGKPVVVDPKGTRYERYAGAALITPNRREASQAAGEDLSDGESLKRAAEVLQRQSAGAAILVTLGPEGMALFEPGMESVWIPASAREVFDVSGAGDTVVSLMGLGLASRYSLEVSAEAANAGAGVVVGKLGTAVVTPGELRESLLRTPEPIHRKVRDAAALQREVSELRRQGKTIAFTNGCFDLLHAGHVRLLEASKRLADVLVVAVDDDASVRSIKGEGRPVLSQEERLRILSALDSVDYICTFSTGELDSLLENLRPDVLTKGSNYEAESIQGKNIVERYGGKVVAVPIVDTLSVSALIQRIRNHPTD